MSEFVAGVRIAVEAIRLELRVFRFVVRFVVRHFDGHFKLRGQWWTWRRRILFFGTSRGHKGQTETQYRRLALRRHPYRIRP